MSELPKNFGKSTSMPVRWPQDASGADPNLSDEQKEEFCRWLTRSRVDLDEGDFISGREWAEYFGITRNEYHMIESRFMKDLKHSEITHDYKAELNDKANLFARRSRFIQSRVGCPVGD